MLFGEYDDDVVFDVYCGRGAGVCFGFGGECFAAFEFALVPCYILARGSNGNENVNTSIMDNSQAIVYWMCKDAGNVHISVR